jgi:hypothetical protein
MRTLAHQAANQPVDSAEMEVDQVRAQGVYRTAVCLYDSNCYTAAS